MESYYVTLLELVYADFKFMYVDMGTSRSVFDARILQMTEFHLFLWDNGANRGH